MTIDFETDASGAPLAAPCLFVETAPLGDLYKSLGVIFSGATASTGGAIVNNPCGGWFLPAHSGTNVLAFNDAQFYDEGAPGYARTPETLSFIKAQRCISLWLGAQEGSFSLTAYKRGREVGRTTVAAQNDYALVRLQVRGGFDRVVLHAHDEGTFLVDDLTFAPSLGSCSTRKKDKTFRTLHRHAPATHAAGVPPRAGLRR